MADPCEKTIEVRSYSRTSEVRIYASSLQRRPSNAPAPRKTLDEMKAELAARIDASIVLANSAGQGFCDDCAYLGEDPARFLRATREEHLVWEETFELRDAAGNTITGTARYKVTGAVEITTTLVVKYCGPRFADSDASFMVKPAALSAEWKVNVWPPSLSDLWKGLPEDERKGYEYKPGR